VQNLKNGKKNGGRRKAVCVKLNKATADCLTTPSFQKQKLFFFKVPEKDNIAV
jgi:hypothetical protein